MPVVCPTVLAGTNHSFRTQMERVAKFCHRLQIDLMDGEFVPHKSIELEKVWWPVGVRADLHLMYKNPGKFLKQIVDLNPNLVIVHAESEGNFFTLQQELKMADIKVGLALLEGTPVSRIEPVLDLLDHVLIFSGELGKFGGRANLSLIDKVIELKSKKINLEVGWDGGVNQHNIKKLADGGVDVLNVGGYIQRSENPVKAYATLEALVGSA